MAIVDAGPGEVIDIVPLGDALDGSKISANRLVKTTALEVVRIVVPAGKDIASHTAPGEVTVQCLEGAIDFTADGHTRRLTAGRLLYLRVGAVHALHGVEDASVLVTIVRCHGGGRDAG